MKNAAITENSSNWYWLIFDIEYDMSALIK